MHADVELGEMEAERARAGAQIREAAVGDPLAPVSAEQRVERVEIGDELAAVRIAVGTEPLPDLDEDGAERLVGVADLGHPADHRRRHPPRRPELAQLGPVQVTCELAGALERVRDRLRPDVRVAVEVASDPGAEAQRLPRAREPLDEGALELGDRIPEALLEEPQPLPDLVDDPRPLGADLVRLPEQRDLLGEPVLEPLPLREGRALVVEAGQERGDPPVGLEDGAARCLGRVGREDELDPEPRACRLDLGLVDPAPVELRERIGERFARNPPLGLVLAAPTDPVVLLGDVDELEEQRERPQHGALALRPERRDRVAERASGAAGARIAGQGPDPLLLVEEAPGPPARRAPGRAGRRAGARWHGERYRPTREEPRGSSDAKDPSRVARPV